LRKAADEERCKARERRAHYEASAPADSEDVDTHDEVDWGRRVDRKMARLDLMALLIILTTRAPE